MDDVLTKHFTLERNLKILEYGLDLGQVVGTRVELMSAKPSDLNLCPVLASRHRLAVAISNTVHSQSFLRLA